MMFVGDDDGRVAVAHIYRVKVSHVCLSLAICRVVLSPNHPATSEVTEGVREKDKGSEEWMNEFVYLVARNTPSKADHWKRGWSVIIFV